MQFFMHYLPSSFRQSAGINGGYHVVRAKIRGDIAHKRPACLYAATLQQTRQIARYG